jgi:P-type Cu+ transporter
MSTQALPKSAVNGGPGAPAARVRLTLEGLNCASCALTAAAALRRAPGVLSAEVSLMTAQAAVEYDPGLTSEVDPVSWTPPN